MARKVRAKSEQGSVKEAKKSRVPKTGNYTCQEEMRYFDD